MIGAGGTVLVATRNRGKTAEFRAAFARLGVAVKDLHEMDDLPQAEETGETFAANALLKAKALAGLTGLAVLADDSGLCVDALDGRPGVYSARYAGEAATDAANNAKLLRELAELAERGRPTRASAGGGEAVAGAEAGVGAGAGLAASAARTDPQGEASAETRAGNGEPETLSAARFVCALALFDPAGGDAVPTGDGEAANEGRAWVAEGAVEGFILAEAQGAGGFGYDPLFWLPDLRKSMAELTPAEKNAISHRGRALAKLLDSLPAGFGTKT